MVVSDFYVGNVPAMTNFMVSTNNAALKTENGRNACDRLLQACVDGLQHILTVWQEALEKIAEAQEKWQQLEFALA